MDRIVNYGNGQELGISASALTPFLYREKHNRDLAVDMRSIQKAVKAAADQRAADPEEAPAAQLSAIDIRIVLYCAHTMAYEYAKKHGEPLPDNDPFEWLGNLDGVFMVYEIAPAIFELWDASSKTLSTPKKK